MRVFVVILLALLIAALSGAVRFTTWSNGQGLWLDIVFLSSTAVCLAAAIIFSVRRVQSYVDQNPPHQADGDTPSKKAPPQE